MVESEEGDESADEQIPTDKNKDILDKFKDAIKDLLGTTGRKSYAAVKTIFKELHEVNYDIKVLAAYITTEIGGNKDGLVALLTRIAYSAKKHPTEEYIKNLKNEINQKPGKTGQSVSRKETKSDSRVHVNRDCTQVDTRLKLSLLSELAAGELDWLEQHIAVCSANAENQESTPALSDGLVARKQYLSHYMCLRIVYTQTGTGDVPSIRCLPSVLRPLAFHWFFDVEPRKTLAYDHFTAGRHVCVQDLHDSLWILSQSNGVSTKNSDMRGFNVFHGAVPNGNSAEFINMFNRHTYSPKIPIPPFIQRLPDLLRCYKPFVVNLQRRHECVLYSSWRREVVEYDIEGDPVLTYYDVLLLTGGLQDKRPFYVKCLDELWLIPPTCAFVFAILKITARVGDDNENGLDLFADDIKCLRVTSKYYNDAADDYDYDDRYYRAFRFAFLHSLLEMLKMVESADI